jgi:hypothetical protein
MYFHQLELNYNVLCQVLKIAIRKNALYLPKF